MPLVIYDANGVELCNTNNMSAGVLADVRSYAANQTDVREYPAYAGRAVYIVPIYAWVWPNPMNVTLDQDKGWPRVTVSAAMGSRHFAVLVI